MKRRLTKSSTNVVLTGTLAGVAEYFGIDPTIVRLIYVLLSFGLIGSPILVYIVLAIVIPSGSKARGSANRGHYGHDNPYYKNNDYGKKAKTERKQAEKIDEDDWSDF